MGNYKGSIPENKAFVPGQVPQGRKIKKIIDKLDNPESTFTHEEVAFLVGALYKERNPSIGNVEIFTK